MRKYHVPLSLLYIFFIHSSMLYGQLVTVDPAAVNFIEVPNSNIHESAEPVYVGVNVPAWELTCIAEPLLHETGSFDISNEQIYINHDLITEFQVMNTSIDLGTGNSGGGQPGSIINTLLFQIHTTGMEHSGNYSGVVRFFNYSVEVAQLVLNLTIENRLSFEISNENLGILASMPEIYRADRISEILIESNTTQWHVAAALSPDSPSEHFTGTNVFIRSSASSFQGDVGAGAGYQSLEEHPVLLSGAQSGFNGMTQLEVKVITDWIIPFGYHHVIIELSVPEQNQIHHIDLNLEISEYNVMALTENSVYFHADGPPNIWPGDKTSTLIIGSNSTYWSVIAEATNLESDNDVIPNERLFMKIDPDDFTGNWGAGVGYHKLDSQLEVAHGTTIEPQDICQLSFKLKTMDIDRPGHYEGTITFTYLSNP